MHKYLKYKLKYMNLKNEYQDFEYDDDEDWGEKEEKNIASILPRLRIDRIPEGRNIRERRTAITKQEIDDVKEELQEEAKNYKDFDYDDEEREVVLPLTGTPKGTQKNESEQKN